MVKEDLLTGAAHGRATQGQDFVLGQGARNPLFLGSGALLPVASQSCAIRASGGDHTLHNALREACYGAFDGEGVRQRWS
jgi:hypothetical protein